MDMIAHRIVLPDADEAARLPNVVKREAFETYLASSSVLERARAQAARIVDEARERAAETLAAAERAHRESEERGYREGSERARVEAVAEVLAMTDMASGFVRDVEDSLVAVVTGAVREIVSRFDDAALVEATVARALGELGADVRATLGVPPALLEDVERRLLDLPGATRLRVVADPALRGSDCRIESGRMIVSGGVDEQLAAMGAALERSIGRAREAVTEPSAPAPDVTGDRRDAMTEDGS